jgi:uncharacterized protein
MQFVVYCLDKTGHQLVRAENRAAHLAHLAQHEASLVAAGPLLDDSGQEMIGTLIILEVAERAQAERFAADDPYAKAGLFASVRITPWRKVLPKPEEKDP